MRKCVFCKSRYRKGSKTSFHSFPSELTLRNMWLQNMKALNWTPKEKDYLCSKHFDTECFVRYNTRTALKSDSVPTLFEGLFENSSTPGNLKSDLRENIRSDHDYESSQTPNETRIGYSIAHDHRYRYESTPRSSKKSLQRTKISLKLSNARVKTLTQRVKRLKIKVTDLKTVINDLSKRNKASEECMLLLKQYDEFQMELFNGQKQRFRKDENLREKWLNSVNCGSRKVTGNSVICSKHFKQEDFVPNLARPVLKEKAIPSMFDVPVSMTIEVEVPATDDVSVEPFPKRPRTEDQQVTKQQHISALTIDVHAQEENTRRKEKHKIEELQRKVKVLTQKLRRRDRKIKNLKSLVTILKKMCYNVDDIETMIQTSIESMNE